MTQQETIRRALAILEARIRSGPALSAPHTVRDYLRLQLHDRGHEVFVCIFLDSQHRVIACDELFRGTLAQTSVYPREVVKAALAHNAAAVILETQSVVGGSQATIEMKWVRKPETGNWWLKIDDVWVGYYPSTNFASGGLADSADYVDFGGEMTGTEAAAEMGSGRFASEGKGKAAYQSRIRYIDPNGTMKAHP